VYEEVKAMREACGEAHLKTILATGELGTMTNIYKASLVSMMAGSDFIKVRLVSRITNASSSFEHRLLHSMFRTR
jgi:deoxyribose-phosphate aldolase